MKLILLKSEQTCVNLTSLHVYEYARENLCACVHKVHE